MLATPTSSARPSTAHAESEAYRGQPAASWSLSDRVVLNAHICREPCAHAAGRSRETCGPLRGFCGTAAAPAGWLATNSEPDTSDMDQQKRWDQWSGWIQSVRQEEMTLAHNRMLWRDLVAMLQANPEIEHHKVRQPVGDRGARVGTRGHRVASR